MEGIGGDRLWANKQHYNLTLPLPSRERDLCQITVFYLYQIKPNALLCGPLPVLSLPKGGPPEWAACGTLRYRLLSLLMKPEARAFLWDSVVKRD